MHFSLNISMYRVSKLFLIYKHTYDMKEDMFHYYPIVLCELRVTFYFTKSKKFYYVNNYVIFCYTCSILHTAYS